MTGSATLDFGAAPGTNHAAVAVTGQTTIGVNDHVEAFLMGNDTTASHTAYEHLIAPLAIKLAVSTVVAGTGFTINGISEMRLTGLFKVRWAWST